jgi:hypothetical protein
MTDDSELAAKTTDRRTSGAGLTLIAGMLAS